ncbi:hypothetical protein CDAR_287541 [Caerostris darwini]|uniref:Uncharacterized protein n=1 Tax=Caerostris darwini TaxID=1538125 RepID=A0AAV4X033_9ARAC|nr:hypothetical protein CDAR_287541 [Caerostris darwini]
MNLSSSDYDNDSDSDSDSEFYSDIIVNPILISHDIVGHSVVVQNSFMNGASSDYDNDSDSDSEFYSDIVGHHMTLHCCSK